MQFDDILKKTMYAYEHNELENLLSGKGDYVILISKYSLDIPTAVELLLHNGIYPVYDLVNNKEQYKQAIKKAIINLADSDDSAMCWWALSIVSAMENYENRNQATFTIYKDMYKLISPQLIKRKEELESNKLYLGDRYENGLWGDVTRIMRITINNYNKAMLEMA